MVMMARRLIRLLMAPLAASAGVGIVIVAVTEKVRPRMAPCRHPVAVPRRRKVGIRLVRQGVRMRGGWMVVVSDATVVDSVVMGGGVPDRPRAAQEGP
ncbi:MAG: hypothetical protein KGO50_06800, partial [Myxococcales bacterium]|nr:hypothetical protein [Myxococcales bacterium]